LKTPLTRDELIAALDRWTGQVVAVRVVSARDELIAISCGELCERSDEKRPALFWPLAHHPPGHPEHAEKPGVYLHPESFESASLHTGATVVELRQDGVTLNIRRL
jgi:hypothetical protein